MILIFHWITALVYSIDKPWKIIRSWKSSWKMSEMKWKCRVKSNRLFLNLISQSNHLILQVLSQKKGFLGKFLICFTEKNPQFGNISLERVFLRGQTEMSSENAYACKSHKPLQLDLLISFPYKKLYATQPIQKNCFCKST